MAGGPVGLPPIRMKPGAAGKYVFKVDMMFKK
jgi:hypothetical protein